MPALSTKDEEKLEKILDLPELPGELPNHWQKHMPLRGTMWRETDFWGDLVLELPKQQLERPETSRCNRDCNWCKEQRQTLKEEQPRLPTERAQTSPYTSAFCRVRRSHRSQRDVWRHREKGYRAGDTSLQRRYVELHMPAHVVLRVDERRRAQLQREEKELPQRQRRKKEAVRNASRPGKGRPRTREAPRPTESLEVEKSAEDVQAILRFRERRQSVLCERPPAAPEEPKRRVDWKPRSTVTFEKEQPQRPEEDAAPERSVQEDLGSRARRLIFRQKQKSAMDRSAIRADRRAHKEAASSLRELARWQLLKEGERIAELVRLKDEQLIAEDFHRYDEDGNGMLQLTEIRGVLEDAGLLPQNDEEKASVRRTIVNMALEILDGETDEEKELDERGNVLQVQQAQERLARSVELGKDRMPELLQRIRRRLKVAKQKQHFARFTQYDVLDEGELDMQEVLKLLQELKLLPDLDEARCDFARWLLSTVKGRESSKQPTVPEDTKKRAPAKAKPRPSRASTRAMTESPRSQRRGSSEKEETEEMVTRAVSQKVSYTHDVEDRFEGNVVLEDLPRLLPDMKFDKFEFEVMADFLLEAHGRLQAQRQIVIAEQLSLTRALFQQFRKELEGMLDLFQSFDDTHSGVLKKVEVWVALSNLGLLPCLDQNKVVMLVMISMSCAEAQTNPNVARFASQVPRNSQRWLGTKAALKALLQSSEFLQLASQVGSLDEGCMDLPNFLYLVHSVRQMQSRSSRDDLAPIFDRMLRRRKKAGNISVNAVGVPEVSQALEYLHLGPRHREDQLKITEFLNEVNEFGFSPLTLDFDSFVRFVRQVREWQAMCTRAADRAYGAELGLSEGMVDEFRVIFDIIDSSGSGELDLLGVKRACGLMTHKSHQQHLGMEELRKIFETLDKDNSGAIDFLEFLHMTKMADLGKPTKGRTVNANTAFAPFGWADDR